MNVLFIQAGLGLFGNWKKGLAFWMDIRHCHCFACFFLLLSNLFLQQRKSKGPLFQRETFMHIKDKCTMKKLPFPIVQVNLTTVENKPKYMYINSIPYNLICFDKFRYNWIYADKIGWNWKRLDKIGYVLIKLDTLCSIWTFLGFGLGNHFSGWLFGYPSTLYWIHFDKIVSV